MRTREIKRIFLLSVVAIIVVASGVLYSTPKYLSAKHAASSAESALIDASSAPSRTSEALDDEELCGVISNKELRDYLSFTTSNYWYSNKPKSGGRGGSFRCQIYSPEVVSGSRFVRITYGLDNAEVRKIRSGALGYSRHEYAAVGVSGEGWKMTSARAPRTKGLIRHHSSSLRGPRPRPSNTPPREASSDTLTHQLCRPPGNSGELGSSFEVNLLEEWSTYAYSRN